MPCAAFVFFSQPLVRDTLPVGSRAVIGLGTSQVCRLSLFFHRYSLRVLRNLSASLQVIGPYSTYFVPTDQRCAFSVWCDLPYPRTPLVLYVCVCVLFCPRAWVRGVCVV